MPSPGTELGAEGEAVEEFVRAAQAFCRVVERRDWPTVGLFARAARETLAQVYAAAAALAAPPPSADSDERPHDGRSREIEQRLSRALGDADVYLLVDADGQAMSGFISMDVADIWDELTRAVAAIEAGDEDAVWSARFAFESHWGPHHAVHVLAPLHALAQSA